MEASFLLYTFLEETQHLLTLVGVVIFMITPKQERRDFIELGLIILLSFLTESAVDIGYWVFDVSVNIVTNVHHIIVFPLIVLLFKRKLNWVNRNAVANTIIFVFLVYALSNFFFIQGPHAINSYTRAVSSVATIIIAITYFYSLIKELPTQSITTLPMFWICAAFLIYRSGTFFIHLSTDYLINVIGDDMTMMWIGNFFLGIIFYSMLCYSLLLIRSQYMKLRAGVAVNG